LLQRRLLLESKTGRGGSCKRNPQEIERKEKPRGEAGQDYNLEKAMGLADDHELYLSIVICGEYRRRRGGARWGGRKGRSTPFIVVNDGCD
jgi:hypothetical protein